MTINLALVKVHISSRHSILIIFLLFIDCSKMARIGRLHRHLRSNVHPSVAILLEDKQTTGHSNKQWGNIRLVMKMTIKCILFLVICYDFSGIDSEISSSIF